MGRTAYTKPQCLYKGNLYLYLVIVTDIGKYCFVNRTNQLWNKLLMEDLGNVSSEPSSFRKRVSRVINEVK
jgi:hypothetical protein